MTQPDHTAIHLLKSSPPLFTLQLLLLLLQSSFYSSTSLFTRPVLLLLLWSSFYSSNPCFTSPALLLLLLFYFSSSPFAPQLFLLLLQSFFTPPVLLLLLLFYFFSSSFTPQVLLLLLQSFFYSSSFPFTPQIFCSSFLLLFTLLRLVFFFFSPPLVCPSVVRFFVFFPPPCHTWLLHHSLSDDITVRPQPIRLQVLSDRQPCDRAHLFLLQSEQVTFGLCWQRSHGDRR